MLNLSVMLGNYLQQTTSADDIFRCIFFLGALRANIIPFYRSMSTVSFMDEPGHDQSMRPFTRCENTYQMEPKKRFPYGAVKNIIRDVLEGYLAEERYEPELCRQMSKTISEVRAISSIIT